MLPEPRPDDPVYLEPLSEEHDTVSFSCGSAYLDWYQRERALSDQQEGISRTVVAVNDPATAASPGIKRVEGYFTLEAGVMPTAAFPAEGEEGAYAISEVPVVYLSCLARALRRRGHGYGDVLLVEALRRAASAAEQIGIAGVFLYALSEGERLYERYGFRRFEDDRRKMFLSMTTIRKMLPSLSPRSA